MSLILVIGWITMTVTHELGHVAGGLIAGAKLVDLRIGPWELPSSIHNPDPRPLLTLWSGPILGCVVPTIVAAIIGHPLAWMVAWFCWLANASYLLLALANGDPFLDTSRLISAGASHAQVMVFGAVFGAVGYERFRHHCIGLFNDPDEHSEYLVSPSMLLVGIASCLTLQSLLALAVR